jgi:hypothetical protein
MRSRSRCLLAAFLAVLFLLPAWLPLMALERDQPCCGEGKFCCCLLFKLTGKSKSQAMARARAAGRQGPESHHHVGAHPTRSSIEKSKEPGRNCSLRRTPRSSEQPSVVSKTFGLRLGWLPSGLWAAELAPVSERAPDLLVGALSFEPDPDTPPPKSSLCI